MSSLDNNPFWCEQHGFTEVITSAGVGSVPKKRCPFCRAESLEKALAAVVEIQRWNMRSFMGDDNKPCAFMNIDRGGLWVNYDEILATLDAGKPKP